MTMRNRRLILSILIVLTICALTAARSFQVQSVIQMQDFIEVKGPTLSARMDSAMKTALSRAPKTPFWVGYSFNGRPGVTIDAYDRQTKRNMGAVAPAAATETRNVVVFLLYDPDRNSITRLQLYNLNR